MEWREHKSQSQDNSDDIGTVTVALIVGDDCPADKGGGDYGADEGEAEVEESDEGQSVHNPLYGGAELCVTRR